MIIVNDSAVNYYYQALNLGCCSSPRSASEMISRRYQIIEPRKNYGRSVSKRGLLKSKQKRTGGEGSTHTNVRSKKKSISHEIIDRIPDKVVSKIIQVYTESKLWIYVN